MTARPIAAPACAIKPGAVPWPGNTPQTPHIAVTILARGMLFHLANRLYFAGAPETETDPILSLIEDPARRATLLAPETAAGHWQFDIHLQGVDETVFFDS